MRRDSKRSTHRTRHLNLHEPPAGDATAHIIDPSMETMWTKLLSGETTGISEEMITGVEEKVLDDAEMTRFYFS